MLLTNTAHLQHSEATIHGQQNSFIQRFQHYLAEFVYGGIDGSITTFAVVAGATGAGMDTSVIIILGFANLIADGLSMSLGAYLAAKSDLDNYHKHMEIEYWEVDNLPEKEREEIREIYAAKGFEGELLEQVVDVITADKDRWVDVMMKEELEMIPENKSPFVIGSTTFISFVLIGLIPLLIYLVDWLGHLSIDTNNLFFIACLLTSLAFIIIGYMKALVNETNKIKGILETLLLGAAAAAVSYLVGNLLEQFFL